MNNFSINPNFSSSGFDNTINEYNKSFSNSLNQVNNMTDGVCDFSTVLDSICDKNIDTKQAGAVFFDENNKTSDISQCEKMAQDIGKGLSNSLYDLNTINKKAEDDFETFASGGNISVHEVMISAQKSSLAMQMAIQLRNQVLSAYNEFKNMSV